MVNRMNHDVDMGKFTSQCYVSLTTVSFASPSST